MRELENASKEMCQRAIMLCAEQYNFNGEEAVRMLCLNTIKVAVRKPTLKAKKSAEVVALPKCLYPMPYSGGMNENCCHALRQNHSLYTQCTSAMAAGKMYCKACDSKCVDGMPEYGTIEQRNAVEINEYVDPKGRKPVSYTKVMKKQKFTEEQALAEAAKFNIEIDECHFIAPEAEVKRGRPKSDKVVVKGLGVKGRPKKAAKVLLVEADQEDLFAALVADATSEGEEEEEAEEMVIEAAFAKKTKTPAEKAEKEALRLKEKTEKEAKLAADKAEKEAKLAAEKAEKEAKKAADKAEKEAKLAADKAEKEAKLAADKAEKEAKKAAEKEAKKAAEKEAKKAAEKESKKVAGKAEKETEDEELVVKVFTVNGVKYLKSKKAGIIYDYAEWTKNNEQVVLGKWNETTQKIDFDEIEEEEEEEEYEA
jgi:hypothetical protein